MKLEKMKFESITDDQKWLMKLKSFDLTGVKKVNRSCKVELI